MNHHGNAIPAQPHVDLDQVASSQEGGVDCRQRVLWRRCRVSAMCDDHDMTVGDTPGFTRTVRAELGNEVSPDDEVGNLELSAGRREPPGDRLTVNRTLVRLGQATRRPLASNHTILGVNQPAVPEDDGGGVIPIAQKVTAQHDHTSVVDPQQTEQRRRDIEMPSGYRPQTRPLAPGKANEEGQLCACLLDPTCVGRLQTQKAGEARDVVPEGAMVAIDRHDGTRQKTRPVQVIKKLRERRVEIVNRVQVVAEQRPPRGNRAPSFDVPREWRTDDDSTGSSGRP